MANAEKIHILDEPKCGYDGLKCPNAGKGFQKHIAWVMGGLLIMCTFISTILYRNWKYEQEIVGLQWRINQVDLVLSNHTSAGSRVREAGLYSTSSSLTSRVRKYSFSPLHLCFLYGHRYVLNTFFILKFYLCSYIYGLGA